MRTRKVPLLSRSLVVGAVLLSWAAGPSRPGGARELEPAPPAPALSVAPVSGAADAPASPALPQPSAARRTVAQLSTGALYGGLYGWTYLAWYRRNPESEGFFVLDEGWFGPRTYAGGADKLGHFWSNYALTRGVSGLLEWGGYPRRTALPAALGLTAGFFAVNEIKDGYHKNYGFSWGDVLFNLAGNATAVLLELNPGLDEMFDIRLQYWPSRGYLEEVGGKNPFNAPEDYSGQAYLLAFHLASLESVRRSRSFGWLEYVDLTLGYRALNFLPETDAPRRQRLYAGVSLNLQRVVERFLMPPGAAREPASVSSGARFLHFVTEIYAPPNTTLEVDLLDRTTER